MRSFQAFYRISLLTAAFALVSSLYAAEITFPVQTPPTNKYMAEDGDHIYHTVHFANKVKFTVTSGEVFAVTDREIIVARRAITVQIQPQPMSGWSADREDWTETRDFRQQNTDYSQSNNPVGYLGTNYDVVTFTNDDNQDPPDEEPINQIEKITPYVRVADLQVDSLNQNPYGGVSGTDDEDEKENTNEGGKILGINATPYSQNSNKPGWADFSAAPASHPPFATMHLFLQSFPSGTQVRFQYSGSDPSQVTQDNNGNWQLPQNGGCLRVWTKNVYQARSLGDYMAPNAAYSFEDLKTKQAQVADGHFVFYVEAVKAGSSLADNQVTVEVKTPGSSWVPLDTVRLVPVEIKATSHGFPPTGLPGKYSKVPEKGSVDNLVSVWPSEEITLYVELPEPFKTNLPPGLITWDAPGHNVPPNSTEYKFKWTDTGTKTVTITVGSNKFKVVINLPNVGNISQADALSAADLISSASIVLYGNQAANYTNSQLPLTPKRDAFRHSYWTALCVSDVLVDSQAVLTVTTAHEHDNKWGIPTFPWQPPNPQDAFNSTMDLRNNLIGLATIHSTGSGTPDELAIRQDLDTQYGQGLMWIYDGDTSQEASEGILSKSNGQKILPP